MTQSEAPVISFIIPVYKALPWLERAVGAILAAKAKAPALRDFPRSAGTFPRF